MSALVCRAVALTALFSLASFLNVFRIRPETQQGKKQDSNIFPDKICTVTGIECFTIALSVGIGGVSLLALSSLSWDTKDIVAKAKTVILVFCVVSLIMILPCGPSFFELQTIRDSFEPSSCPSSYLVLCAVHVTAYIFLDFLQRILQVHQKETRENLLITKSMDEARQRAEDSCTKRLEMKALFAKTITGEIRYTVNMAADTIRSLMPSLLPITERIPSYTIPLPSASIFAIQTALQNIEHLSYHLDSISRMWFTGSSGSTGTAITSDGVKPVATAFDVGELLQSVGDALAGTAALADVELVMHHHPDGSPENLIIRGDEGGFRHVVVNLLCTICASASPGSSIEIGVSVSDDSTSTTMIGESRCHLKVIHTSPTKKKATTLNGTSREIEGVDVKQVPNANTTAKLVNSIGGTLKAQEIDGGFVFEVIIPVNASTAQVMNDLADADRIETCLLHTPNGTPRSFVKVPDEPSTADLRSFILEMRCKKVFLHAKVHSISAKHFTSTLTSWGADICHLPIHPEANSPSLLPESLPLNNDTEGIVPSSTIEPNIDHDDNSAQRITDASFIVIDDDIPTLKEKVLMLIELSLRPSNSTSLYSTTSSNSTETRGKTQPPSIIPAVIHFTSVSYYQLAREAVEDALKRRMQPSPSSADTHTQHISHSFNATTESHSTPSQHYAIPPNIPFSEHLTSFVVSRIFLVPKPSGPRRFLITLFNASRLPTNPNIDLPKVLSSRQTTFGKEVNPTENGSGDPTSETLGMNSSRLPMITTPGGTAILFEPVPGASCSSIRTGVKSMRARLVMPVQVNGTRMCESSIRTMDWSMLGQNVAPITAPVPGTISSVQATTPQSYFPSVVSGTSAIPSRVQPSSAPANHMHLTLESKYRSYRIPGKFGSSETGMSSSSSSSSVSVDTPVRIYVNQSATAGGMLSASPITYERPLGGNTVQPGNLARMVRNSSSTVSDAVSISVGPGRRVLTGDSATSVLIPPRGLSDNSVSPASGKLSAISNSGSPVADRRKARGTGTLSALFGERNLTPPINVLIVEDNPINQTILSTFLRKRKIEYSVASNGQEAVDKWSMGGFHLVLMDIQLPVMDGIQATKEIRRMERLRKIGLITPQGSKVAADQIKAFTDDRAKASQKSSKSESNSNETFSIPPSGDEPTTSLRSPVIIVALTASSLQSDRHAALAAGCNDFLTKPVSLVWLEKKIMEWGCMQALIDFEGWKKWKSGAGSLDKETSWTSNSSDTTATSKTAIRGIKRKTQSMTSSLSSSSTPDIGALDSPLPSDGSLSVPVPKPVLLEPGFPPSELHVPTTIHNSTNTQPLGTKSVTTAKRRRPTGILLTRTVSEERSSEREQRKLRFLGPDSRSPSFSTDAHGNVVPPSANGSEKSKPEYFADAFWNNLRYRQDRGEGSLRQ